MRLRVLTLLSAATIMAGVVGITPADAAHKPTVAGRGRAAKVADTNAGVTLWNQYNNDSGIATVAQDFEPTYDVYDSFGANNFIVPAGQTWVITQVSVGGVYFNGAEPAASENVIIYADAAGVPGTILKSTTATGTDVTGSFTVKVPKFKLTAGRYWLGFQVNMDFSVGGEWGWEGRTAQAASPAVWSNPRNGFATGCTSFTAVETCNPSGEGPDHVFKLKGSITV